MKILKVEYKNGYKHDYNINYLYVDTDGLIFTESINPHGLFMKPLVIPFKYIKKV